MTDLELRAVAWLNGPDTGLSSQALLCFLMGFPNPGTSPHHTTAHPHDPDDFGRCYRMLEKFPELRERLHDARQFSAEWRNLVDCWPELERLHLAAPKKWSNELYEALQTCAGWRCVDCGARVNQRVEGAPSRCVGGCKPPEQKPTPAPKTVQSIRENLVVTYLILNELGDVEDSTEQECEECEGEGTIECGECEQDRDCEECSGTGRIREKRTLAETDLRPELEEGQSAIIAIVDKRALHGPRLVYDDIQSANRGLKYVLELPDADLQRMFSEKAAA